MDTAMMRKNTEALKAGANRELSLPVLFILMGLFILSSPPLYAEEIKKTTMELCLECHPASAAMIQKQNVHMPVKLGLCTACHDPHVSRHSGLLGFRKEELCYSCHDRRKGFTGEVVHKPVLEGNCFSCHEAHSTDSPGLLTKPLSQGCFECHPKERLLAKKNVHPQVAEGKCTACHSPHASDRLGLLDKERKDLCTGCHMTESIEFAGLHTGYDVSGSDCLGCHSPHSSDRPAMLKANLHKPFEEKNCTACHLPETWGPVRAGIGLCSECHKATMPGFNKINSHLVADVSDNVCMSCHSPHASDEKSLLSDKQDRVCYACHSDTKQFVAGSKHIHPKLDICLDCHVSHGSNNRFFLTLGDETCSTEQCHPTQGVFTHPVGEKIIDPRSKAHMNCSTCHNPMGSSEVSILRLGKDIELCIQCHQL
jgi:predicted CXXCH cytochrome family protein